MLLTFINYKCFSLIIDNIFYIFLIFLQINNISISFLVVMPPKVDPNSEFDIFLRVRGGIVLPAQTIAPKVGPYGLPPKVVGDKILEAT